MRKGSLKTVVAVAVLVSSVVFVGWVRAQSGAVSSLTAQDAYDIEQLYAAMYQGSDFRNVSLWLSTWADTGVFALPTGDEIASREALAAWRERSFRGQTGDTGRRHYFPTIRLTATADGGATAFAYWILLDVSTSPASIASTGIAEDRFEKTADGWKFQRHAVQMDPVVN